MLFMYVYVCVCVHVLCCAFFVVRAGYNAAQNMFKGVGGGKNAIAQQGFLYTYTFNKSGIFDYRCVNHPYVMFGQIKVKPAGEGGTSTQTKTASVAWYCANVTVTQWLRQPHTYWGSPRTAIVTLAGTVPTLQ